MVEVYVLIEGTMIPYNIKVEEYNDLFDIAPQICALIALSTVRTHHLTFFKDGDRIEPIHYTKFVNTTRHEPLVIRYPLSEFTVNVHCSLSRYSFNKTFRHNTGLWYLIRHQAEMEWPVEFEGSPQYFFLHEKRVIEDEFLFNDILSRLVRINRDSGEIELKLSIKFRDKKPFSDWEIKDVLKMILNQEGDSISAIPKFEIGKTTDKMPTIAAKELKLLIDELKKNNLSFDEEDRNEYVCREFVSPFMTTAVRHIQINVNKNLKLKAEQVLTGSHGYGSVDYSAYLNDLVALVQEVKKNDFEKGVAQNIVQVCSAVEVLTRKKKIDDVGDDDGDDIPILMYGMVTNGSTWYFIRWAGSAKNPTVQLSGPHICEFESETMPQVQEIIGYVTYILEKQVLGLNDKSVRPKIKRRRT